MAKKVSVILLILFVFSVIVFFAFKVVSSQNLKKKNFHGIIFSVDRSMKIHAYKEALVKLRKISMAEMDLSETKSYLKRVYFLCKMQNDYTFFTEKALDAVKKYPHDAAIQTLYFFGLLKTGSYKKGFKFSLENKKNKLLNPLRMELFLSSDTKLPLKNTDLSSPLLSLDSRMSYVYDEAAQVTKNKGFKFDEALIFLENGMPKAASAILKSLPVTYSHRNILLFYSEYETGNFTGALHLLNTYDLGFSVETFLLFKNDLLMNLKEYEQAEENYREFVTLYPRVSWIPYANLAWIASRKNSTKEVPLVLKGMTFFPENSDLLYSIVDYLVSIRAFTDAERLIHRYGNDDPVLTIVALHLKGTVEPGLLIAKLQELVSRENVSAQIKKYYCWFLVKTGNIALLKVYLHNEKQYGKEAPWLSFFEALVKVDAHSFNEAEDLFKTLLTREKDWTIVFDSALTAYYDGNYKKAVEIFQSAENAVPDEQVHAQNEKSFIRTYIALSLEKLGNKRLAIRELHYALSLDKNNMRAVLELDKLE